MPDDDLAARVTALEDGFAELVVLLVDSTSLADVRRQAAELALRLLAEGDDSEARPVIDGVAGKSVTRP